MKKLSAVLAIFVTSVLLMALASRTEAVAPTSITGWSLAPTSTATPLPILEADAFDMRDAFTYHATNDVFSIKTPKSWQVRIDTTSQTYTFFAGKGQNAALVIAFTNLADLSKSANLTTTATSARDLLEQEKKQFGSTVTTSEVYSASVGYLKGAGLTLTSKGKPVQIADIRLVEVTKDRFVFTIFQTYLQYWPTAKPVLDKVLASLTISPENFPTATPTPNLALNAASFSGIKQAFTKDGAPIVGDPSAKIIILEFADFSCPHCLEFQPSMRNIIDKYVRSGDARVIVRFLTFVGESYSELATKGVICAAKQGHFLEMEDALFTVQEQMGYTSFTTEVIQSVAAKLDLNTDKFAACMKDPATAALLANDKSVAEGLGVNAVPWVLYSTDGKQFKGIPSAANGEPTNHPTYDELVQLIEKASSAK